MDKYLKSYIDNNIIREYAYNLHGGYYLEVQDIDEHDKQNLLDVMFSHDDELKDILLDRMQLLINERLAIVDSEDRYNRNLKPVQDMTTGEINWIPRRIA